MKIVSTLSSVALLTSLSSISFLTSAHSISSTFEQAPAQKNANLVEVAGLFDVLDDVLETTDDVLDIQEQERRREEEREARARAAEERQQLIEIERIRQERLAEEQRADSERQRFELEQQAQQSPQQNETNGTTASVVVSDDSPKSCTRTRIGESTVEDRCQRFTLVEESDIDAYLFRFSFDEDLFTFVVPSETNQEERTKTYFSNVMFINETPEEITGFCNVTTGDGGIEDIFVVTCEAVSKGITFWYTPE